MDQALDGYACLSFYFGQLSPGCCTGSVRPPSRGAAADTFPSRSKMVWENKDAFLEVAQDVQFQ